MGGCASLGTLLIQQIGLRSIAMALLSSVQPTFVLAPIALAQAVSPGSQPTFSRDMAPIIAEHCAPCHRPGQAGPFNLLTYSDVRTRGRLIVEVTKRRSMPPWKPAPGEGGPFSG